MFVCLFVVVSLSYRVGLKPIGPTAPIWAPRLRGHALECNLLSACQVHTTTHCNILSQLDQLGPAPNSTDLGDWEPGSTEIVPNWALLSYRKNISSADISINKNILIESLSKRVSKYMKCILMKYAILDFICGVL